MNNPSANPVNKNETTATYVTYLPTTALFNGRELTFDQIKAKMANLMSGAQNRSDNVFTQLNTKIEDRKVSK